MTHGGGLSVSLAARIGTFSLDVEIDTGPGTLLLVGPNGAGKSSLLKAVLGALPHCRGRIQLGAELLFDSSAAVERSLEQRRIGYVPQDYALFPHLSVRQNLEFAAFSPKHAAPADQRRARVQSLSEEFSLTSLLERAPATLSGGERQRVALARALCVQPRALLLDEPLAALDRHAVDEVRRTLAQHLRALSLPTLLVSHAAADLHTFGERIAVIEHGRIIQQGNFEQLRQNPGSPFVAQLVAG